MKQPGPEPTFFIRSFIIVALHYVLFFIVFAFGLLAVTWIGFPETHELWNSDTDEFTRVLENTPELLWPTGMCVWLALVGCAISFLIGFQLGWLAPFPKAPHGVFLGVVCAVSFLQSAFSFPSVPKWFLIVLLVTSPVLIVAGARMGERMFVQRFGKPQDNGGDEPEIA